MIGFTDCCHHLGGVKFVSALLLRQTGAMETAGGGRESVLCIVLVNPAHVRLGGDKEGGICPPYI